MHADTFDYNRFNKWRMCLELSKGLTEFEKKVHTFVKERGEVLICNTPSRMMGAVPNLKNRGAGGSVQKTHDPLGVQEEEVCESYRAHGDKREGVIKDVSCKFLMHATR